MEKSIGLTAQEKRIVDYHFDTVSQGKTGRDDLNRPITVFSTGIKIPDGERHGGSFVSVPGWNRETMKRMNEGEAYKFWKKEIDAGKWPMYSTGEELNQRSQDIHKIMDERPNG